MEIRRSPNNSLYLRLLYVQVIHTNNILSFSFNWFHFREWNPRNAIETISYSKLFSINEYVNWYINPPTYIPQLFENKKQFIESQTIFYPTHKLLLCFKKNELTFCPSLFPQFSFHNMISVFHITLKCR